MLRSRAIVAVLLLVLPACAAVPCGPDPLLPPLTPARWAVRYNDLVVVSVPDMPIPGVTPVLDPPGVGAYAALALFDAESRLISERWIDTTTRWDGATGTLDAAARLPERMSPGRLTLLLADGLRPIVGFDLAMAEVSAETPLYSGAAPEAGGQLYSWIDLGDGSSLASRTWTEGGAGDDLVRVDEALGFVQETISLSTLSFGDRIAPTRVAPFATASGLQSRVVVGLGLPDEPGAGAVAIYTPSTRDLVRFDLVGYSGCTEVAALAPDAGAPDVARVAVLCLGDLAMPPEARLGAGIVILSAEDDEAPSLTATLDAGAGLAGRMPTGELVGLAGDWIALVSRGDPTVGRPDSLLAVHLTTGDARVLYEEAWSEIYGEAIGSGDFAPDLGAAGELLWPTVASGLIRFEMTSGDAGAVFQELAPADVPMCARLPPRVARHLPPAPAP